MVCEYMGFVCMGKIQRIMKVLGSMVFEKVFVKTMTIWLKMLFKTETNKNIL